MTMTFYLGKEYFDYLEKFQRVKEHIRGLKALKTGSNAETFRWILDRMDMYVKGDLIMEEDEKEQ